MYEFAKTSLLIHPFQFVKTSSVAIGHHPIMCPNHTRKKTKTDDPLPVIMFKAFIIDEGDVPVQDRSQQLLVAGLLFFSVRKEKVGLVSDELLNRHLFYPE